MVNTFSNICTTLLIRHPSSLPLYRVTGSWSLSQRNLATDKVPQSPQRRHKPLLYQRAKLLFTTITSSNDRVHTPPVVKRSLISFDQLCHTHIKMATILSTFSKHWLKDSRVLTDQIKFGWNLCVRWWQNAKFTRRQKVLTTIKAPLKKNPKNHISLLTEEWFNGL